MGTVPNVKDADANRLHPKGGPFGFKVKAVHEEDKDGNPLVDKNGDGRVLVILEPDSDDPNRGDVMHNLSLSGKADFRIKEFLEAIGLPVEGGYGWDHCEGKHLNAYIVHSDYNGKTYANVSAMEPYSADTSNMTTAPSKESAPF